MILSCAESCHTTWVLLCFLASHVHAVFLLCSLPASVVYLFEYSSSYKSGFHKLFALRISSPPNESLDSFGFSPESCHHWNKDSLGRKDFWTWMSERAWSSAHQPSCSSSANASLQSTVSQDVQRPSSGTNFSLSQLDQFRELIAKAVGPKCSIPNEAPGLLASIQLLSPASSTNSAAFNASQ